MIASLPMYERAETVSAHNMFWSILRDGLNARGIDAPQRLSRTNEPWLQWRSPDLVLSQTCSLPFRSELHKIVNLVGTPDYGLPDTLPGHYFSVLIARANDQRINPARDHSATMAVNDHRSQSGWAAALDHLGGRPNMTHLTGSHLASARAVIEGQADWAALDAISWRGIIQSSKMEMALRVFGVTRQTPGLPLITSGKHDPKPIAEAITDTLHRLDKRSREDLGIRSLVQIPEDDYLCIPIPSAT
jgi:hypothetical protein